MKETARMSFYAKYQKSAAAFEQLGAILDEAPFERPEERATWRARALDALGALANAGAEEVCAGAKLCRACVLKLQVQLTEINAAKASPTS